MEENIKTDLDKYEVITEKHDCETNALIIPDYPWGFRLRCVMRVHIETTKKGDRFVQQTQDPRSNKWCAPKKTTYSDVMVLYREKATGHVKVFSWSPDYTEESSLNRFLELAGPAYQFSAAQREKIKIGRAIYEVRKGIKIEIGPATYRTPEQQAEHDAEQNEIKREIHEHFYKVVEEYGKQEIKESSLLDAIQAKDQSLIDDLERRAKSGQPITLIG